MLVDSRYPGLQRALLAMDEQERTALLTLASDFAMRGETDWNEATETRYWQYIQNATKSTFSKPSHHPLPQFNSRTNGWGGIQSRKPAISHRRTNGITKNP